MRSDMAIWIWPLKTDGTEGIKKTRFALGSSLSRAGGTSNGFTHFAVDGKSTWDRKANTKKYMYIELQFGGKCVWRKLYIYLTFSYIPGISTIYIAHWQSNCALDFEQQKAKCVFGFSDPTNHSRLVAQSQEQKTKKIRSFQQPRLLPVVPVLPGMRCGARISAHLINARTVLVFVLCVFVMPWVSNEWFLKTNTWAVRRN